MAAWAWRMLVKLTATSRRFRSFGTSAARGAISRRPPALSALPKRAVRAPDDVAWGALLSASALPEARRVSSSFEPPASSIENQVDTGRHLKPTLTHSKQRMGVQPGCHTFDNPIRIGVLRPTLPFGRRIAHLCSRRGPISLPPCLYASARSSSFLIDTLAIRNASSHLKTKDLRSC